ncbi:MAG: transglutaminase domain-containing protein [Candidatus Methylumidiphilus sp.]
MRRLQIDHLTTYAFGEAVSLLPHRLLLRPREGQDVRIESATLAIAPAHALHWQCDVYGNTLAVAHFAEPSAKLSIASHVLLCHYGGEPLNFLVAEHAVRYPFQYEPAERIDLAPYLAPVFPQDQPQIGAWLQQFWQAGQIVETYLLLDWINKGIAYGFRYWGREQPGVQTPAETLDKRSGSCRDTATLFIEACRCLGLAARFVSGYLYSPWDTPGPGATHAWSEVYLPGAGWKGFDATSGLLTGPDHIAVAVNRHPEAVSPVAGSFLASRALSPAMQVTVQVKEIP